jgi:hypothetical protein
MSAISLAATFLAMKKVASRLRRSYRPLRSVGSIYDAIVIEASAPLRL